MSHKIKRIFVMLIAACGFLLLSGFDRQEQKVYDFAGILSDQEEEQLKEQALQYADKVELDFVIVTTDDKAGKTARQYVEDFYEEKGFGYEYDYGSSVILLIDMEDREARIATEGIAIQYLDDTIIENILDAVFEYLPKGDYYNSGLAFLTSAASYAQDYISDPVNQDKIEHWKEEGYSDYSEYYADHYKSGGKYYSGSGDGNAFTYLKNPVICVVFGMILAAVFLIIQKVRAKTRMTVNGSTYMDKNQIHFNDRQDIYLGTTTVKRVIEKKSSGGGGSGGSFHMGSGGHSHGGGGRKF